MKEENKLLVFDKKEVFILLTFMVTLFLASFVFGVRVGKDYSFKNSTVEKEDLEKLEVLSAEEESVNQKIEGKPKGLDKELSYDLLKKKIEEELSKSRTSGDKPAKEINNKKIGAPLENSDKKPKQSEKANFYSDNQLEQSGEVIETESKKDIVSSKVMAEVYLGRWTIQLASHRQLKDANSFADSFKVRGYEPIINEVNLGEKGTWYRVSIGSFESLVEAKNYVIKEEDLFSEIDHVFIQFE